jgi:alpha-beta hydrolase superfamily lysophospholipase
LLNNDAMNSFRNHPSWTTYRAILAEEFGIVLTKEPEECFRAVRGHRVRIDHWPASGVARGTLLLVHGGGGNGRILAPLAEPFAERGWKVLAPDLPGYGLTTPAPGYRGEYSEWPAVLSEIADSERGPVVMMGLSMGGLTALLAAQGSRNVCGVIATTLLDLSDRGVFVRAARWSWLGRLSLIGMAAMPWLFDRIVLPLSLTTPLAAMSSNRRMQTFFQNDPLIGKSWKAARFFRMAHQHTVKNWALHCPLLLVHPGQDAWTPTELSLAVFDKIQAAKRFVELSNGSHLPAEEPANGELIVEVERFLNEIVRNSRFPTGAGGGEGA